MTARLATGRARRRAEARPARGRLPAAAGADPAGAGRGRPARHQPLARQRGDGQGAPARLPGAHLHPRAHGGAAHPRSLRPQRPLAALAEAAIGRGQGQAARRKGRSRCGFPRRRPGSPAVPHIDGISTPDNGVPPGTLYHFTALGGVFLSDVTEPDRGNLTVWPGSHLLLADHLRREGPRAVVDRYPDPAAAAAAADPRPRRRRHPGPLPARPRHRPQPGPPHPLRGLLPPVPRRPRHPGHPPPAGPLAGVGGAVAGPPHPAVNPFLRAGEGALAQSSWSSWWSSSWGGGASGERRWPGGGSRACRSRIRWSSMRPATEAAFCRATRTTLAGSITPAATEILVGLGGGVEAVARAVLGLAGPHLVDDDRPIEPGVAGDLAQRLLEGPPDDVDAVAPLVGEVQLVERGPARAAGPRPRRARSPRRWPPGWRAGRPRPAPSSRVTRRRWPRPP